MSELVAGLAFRDPRFSLPKRAGGEGYERVMLEVGNPIYHAVLLPHLAPVCGERTLIRTTVDVWGATTHVPLCPRCVELVPFADEQPAHIA